MFEHVNDFISDNYDNKKKREMQVKVSDVQILSSETGEEGEHVEQSS